MDVVAVWNEIGCYVEGVAVVGALVGVEEVAADEGGVVVIGVGSAFFVWTVERSMSLSFVVVLLVEIDGSFL